MAKWLERSVGDREFMSSIPIFSNLEVNLEILKYSTIFLFLLRT